MKNIADLYNFCTDEYLKEEIIRMINDQEYWRKVRVGVRPITDTTSESFSELINDSFTWSRTDNRTRWLKCYISL